MTVAVAILGDVHFTVGKGHPILARAEQIAAAIASTPLLDHLILVLSGDLANWGLAEEFEVAGTFVTQIKERLSRRFPHIQITTAAVPGNHDCFLPKEAIDHRRSTVEASKKTILEAEPDEHFVADLLRPQENFWAFANQVTDFASNSDAEKICKSVTVKVADKIVQLNLLNSSLLSQHNENKAELLLPVEYIKRHITTNADVALSVTILHHPTFWIEPTNMTGLRQALNRFSDVAITGHEHFNSAYLHTQATGEQVAFYESPALFDDKRPTSSAFRVVLFELDKLETKQILYRWKDSLYRASQEYSDEWSPLLTNRSSRKTFDLTKSQIEFLTDVGIAYIHPDSTAIELSDIFVYPDLSKEESNSQYSTLKGKDVLREVFKSEPVVIEGGTLSGKSSLAKMLTLHGNSVLDRVTVLLNGTDIDGLELGQFEKYVYRIFSKQFSDPDLDAYKQLLPSERCIVIDDWHLAKLTEVQRHAIYKFVKNFCSSPILIVNDLFSLKQMASRVTSSAEQPDDELGFHKFSIIGLSHTSRGALVERWYQLRNDSALNPPETSNAARVSEDQLSKLLGKDNLPPYAFFALCLLQAHESNKPPDISGGSFGYYHEILIQTALTKGKHQDAQLEKKFALSAEIAFWMWREGSESISRIQIDEVAAEYRNKHYMTLQVGELLEALVASRLLYSSEGHYRFAYNQFYYYFVARYFKDNLSRRGSENLQPSLDLMIDEISSTQNSSIVMFLIFFGVGRDSIIKRLLSNANAIYDEIGEARLQDDVVAFNKRRDYLPAPPISEHDDDVAENRRKDRTIKDESKQDPVGREEMESYSYSSALSETRKMHLAEKNIDALGQVIRNFSATLLGQEKVEVLQTTYKLGLRTMASLLADLARYLDEMASTVHDEEQSYELAQRDQSITDFLKDIDQFVLVMGKLVGLHYCRKISSAVGVVDNELAYAEALKTMPESAAIKLVDTSIQIEHSRTFPEALVRQRYEQIRAYPFAASIMQFVVTMHLLMNKVEPTARKSMARLFSLDLKQLDKGKTLLGIET